MAEKDKRKFYLSIILAVLVACALLANILVVNLAEARGRELLENKIDKDNAEYVFIGYNLQKYGVFSLDLKPAGGVEPTAFREPLFPAWIAFLISINPYLKDAPWDFLYNRGLLFLRVMQIPVILLIMLLISYFVFRATASLLYSCLCLTLLGTSHIMGDLAIKLFSEHMAALMLTITSIFLHMAIVNRKRTILYFSLLGVSLAFLVLVKAVFLYFFIILILVFTVYIYKDKINRKKLAGGLVIFICLFSIISGSWALRNYLQFNRFFISCRSGAVLLERSHFDNELTKKEYLASYLHYIPIGFFSNELKNRYFEFEDYKRLIDLKEGSIFYEAKRGIIKGNYDNALKIINEEATGVEWDSELRSMAVQKILKTPFKHILTTFSFAWRGIFVEESFTFFIPVFGSSARIIVLPDFFALVNIAYLISFLSLIAFSLKFKKYGLFLFLLPSLYLFMADAFFTIGLSRFNTPAIPVLSFSLIYCIFIMAEHFIRKKPFDQI